ncbi:MAG: hypothetical protein SPH79_06145 [Schaalia hyovaginalis]|uniref:hypothetical protein n=1 Tax=Schaalia hyovaginalis TaxID=29316 RepID=UPI002A91E3A2|nr:hypothetical protein [Schaalia hyovaginalis]MDY6214053.1 hypothetical protein [Schaalia hyovaginalis]
MKRKFPLEMPFCQLSTLTPFQRPMPSADSGKRMEHDDDPNDEMLITRLDSPPGTVDKLTGFFICDSDGEDPDRPRMWHIGR